MSSQFDDLARALVTPTSRRRAFRLLGSAAVVAVTGSRARPALAHGTNHGCPPPTTSCTNGRGSEVCVDVGETCCDFPEALVRCKAGTKCGDSINNACVDACPKRCKDETCCPKSKGRCVGGTCCPAIRTTFAPGTGGKGVACCPPGTVAVPGGTGKCCAKGDLDCCEPKSIEGDDELVQLTPKLKRGQLCVKGKVRSK
jgi:hypothetical protein